MRPEKQSIPLLLCFVCHYRKPYDAMASKRICHTCHTLPLDTIAEQCAMHGAMRHTNRYPGKRKPREVPVEKECASCWYLKHRSAYHADTRRPDQLQPECKDCRAMRRMLKAQGILDQWPSVREVLRAEGLASRAPQPSEPMVSINT